MKTPAAVVTDVLSRVERTWATDLTGATSSWPHRFPLGSVGKDELESGWRDRHQPLIQEIRGWARENPVYLHTVAKRVYTTTQDIPTHIEVPDLDAAALVVGSDWSGRLARARERLIHVLHRFPATKDPARVLRLVAGYSDTDFDLLLTVASWFRTYDATGHTPRQVPIPGVHAKWLNTHQPVIIALSGRESLGLLPKHPARIHFTYLDPTHRAAGGRTHDSATVGDSFSPPYSPSVVIISENKDTAINFPTLPGGIAVEGEGFGGKAAASFPWLTDAPRLLYWGDIDSHGYEILNGWRADGVPVTSILMDSTTYDAHERFGTDTDKNGIALRSSPPKSLPHLTTEERAVYDRLISPNHNGHRRVEQERVPLHAAAAAVSATQRAWRTAI